MIKTRCSLVVSSLTGLVHNVDLFVSTVKYSPNDPSNSFVDSIKMEYITQTFVLGRNVILSRKIISIELLVSTKMSYGCQILSSIKIILIAYSVTDCVISNMVDEIVIERDRLISHKMNHY